MMACVWWLPARRTVPTEGSTVSGFVQVLQFRSPSLSRTAMSSFDRPAQTLAETICLRSQP